MPTSRSKTRRQEVCCKTRGVLQTIRLGTQLSRALRPGDVVALTGELGAGKTYFIKGIAEGLSIPRREVVSPTYKFLNTYSGKFVLNHIDAYRLSSSSDASDTIGDEIVDKEAVTVIEWADRINELIPKTAIQVRIEITGVRTRKFILSGGSQFRRIRASVSALQEFCRLQSVLHKNCSGHRADTARHRRYF